MSIKCISTKNITFGSWISNFFNNKKDLLRTIFPAKKPDLLFPLRNWLNNFQVSDRNFAHKLCATIPTQCPFAKTVKIFDRKLFTIPPLCKLNPLYDEVVSLRFRALCYLADECGEDISSYC